MPFFKLWRRNFRPKKSASRQRSRRQLLLEDLEVRAVPAVFMVTSVNDSGTGSLRTAIHGANASSGADTIQFNIPASGVQTITVSSPLPQIASGAPLTIDGWSQPGFSGAPLIEISAGGSGAQYGLSLFASNSMIRGLTINGFANAAIAVWGGDNNKIQGNFLGSNATGNALIGSSSTAALYLSGGSAANVIGVDGDGISDAIEGNLLVGSLQMGVWLNGSGTAHNRIAGNRIGISKSSVDLANRWGVYVSGGASNNIIGSNNDESSDWLEANVISGNEGSGIAIVGASATGNRISRNFVYDNEGSEIDLEDDGISDNDYLDADAGANHRTNFPIIGSLEVASNSVQLAGTHRAQPDAAYRLEFFAAAKMDASGHGGSQRFLGFASVATNANGVASFAKTFNAFLPHGWVVTATATDAAGNTSEFSPAVWQGADLSKTFELHSHPSATKVIYLDFDGHTTTDTKWNVEYGRESIQSPAYSLDNNARFNEQELFNIQRIFYSVAEDFRPFNVNVTTEEPPLADLAKVNDGFDTRWGERVAIGGFESGVLGSGNAGGRAYHGSFNWASDTPVFVFARSLSNGKVQSVAAASSHEAGHSLGLEHDGQGGSDYYAGHGIGDISWGPIMGNPYGQSVTQWSKGEYTGASNGEDDLALIASGNGFGYRGDDYENSPSSAAPLATAGATVLQTGIIGSNTDIDMFKFTTPGGKVDLTASPDGFDPNLDIRLELLDSAGKQLAASAPASRLDARLITTILAGTYYVRVNGTGAGSPLAASPTGYTGYGSLGAYAITGWIPYNQPPTVGLGGTIGYTRNSSPGVNLAPSATVKDPDSPNFNQGILTVAIVAGEEAANRLLLTGGAFTLSGNNVQCNGLTIGSRIGNGSGTTPLRVQFNINGTPAIVQALVRNIRFKTVSSTSNSPRVIEFSLTDGEGGIGNTATKTVNVTG